MDSAIASTSTTGVRVLIVEDEPLIAMVLVNMLEDLGCVVLGPATHLPDALAAAQDMELDAAILDLNLQGASALPVAKILREREIPIILSSGYGDLPEDIATATLRKPYDAAAVDEALRAALLGMV